MQIFSKDKADCTSTDNCHCAHNGLRDLPRGAPLKFFLVRAYLQSRGPICRTLHLTLSCLKVCKSTKLYNLNIYKITNRDGFTKFKDSVPSEPLLADTSHIPAQMTLSQNPPHNLRIRLAFTQTLLLFTFIA